MLNVLLRRKADGRFFLITNVYSPTGNNSKATFFEEFRNTSHLSRGLWVAIGDFNVLLSLQDKNRTPSNISDILAFREVVNDTRLFDLPFQNKSFTWSNSRNIPTLECLDRALISQDWFLHFPRSTLRALLCPRSDHTPLVLSAFTFVPTPSFFRFESFWLRCPSVFEVISNAWNLVNSSSELISRFSSKVDGLRKALIIWSKGFSSALNQQTNSCL